MNLTLVTVVDIGLTATTVTVARAHINTINKENFQSQAVPQIRFKAYGTTANEGTQVLTLDVIYYSWEDIDITYF